MRTVTLPYLSSLRPVQDKTPTPMTEVERFIAANLEYCQPLAARITAGQCKLNRKNGLYLCGKCDTPMQTREAENQEQHPVEPVRRYTRHQSPFRASVYNRTALRQHEQAQIEPEPVAVETAEGRGQRAEGRGQRAEGRGQRRRRSMTSQGKFWRSWPQGMEMSRLSRF